MKFSFNKSGNFLKIIYKSMLLRNHGFDTITLYFSTSRYTESTNSYSDNELYQLHKTLLSLSEERIKEKVDRFYHVMSYEFFINEHIKCYTNVYCSVLEFSLSTLLHGHNIDGLSIDNIPNAIEILEGLIGIDPRKAVIRRLDYCFNFASDILVTMMHEYITSSYRRLRKATEEHTLYFKNKSREICFYSQVDKFIGTPFEELIKDIRNSWNANELLRVEFRLKADTLKKKKYRFQDIMEKGFQEFLGIELFDLIKPIDFRNPECTDHYTYSMQFRENMTSGNFFEECMRRLISNEGHYDMWKQVQQSRKRFKSEYHYRKSLEKIDSAIDSIDTLNSDCEKLDIIPLEITRALFHLGWLIP
jgi:hypothetical protein